MGKRDIAHRHKFTLQEYKMLGTRVPDLFERAGSFANQFNEIALHLREDLFRLECLYDGRAWPVTAVGVESGA